VDEVVELPPDRVGELFTLQRAAWVVEGQLNGSLDIPPLTQTLAELVEELRTSRCLAVFDGHRLIGSVRGHERDGVLQVNRLGVVPDLQGRGVGSRLLTAIEATTDAESATLVTGARSPANHAFYTRHGYADRGDEEIRPGLFVTRFTKVLR